MLLHGKVCKDARGMAEMPAAGRKRKTAPATDSEVPTSSSQFKPRRLIPASSGNDLGPCWSSDPARVSPNFADLEEIAVTGEYIATSADSRDEPATREVEAESGELESTATLRESNYRRRPAAEKMPTETDLEEFFAAAEKNLQKEFTNKYNYDAANDEPLEGRYEWVPAQSRNP